MTLPNSPLVRGYTRLISPLKSEVPGKAPWPKKEKLAIEAEPPTAIAIQPNLVNRGHTIAGLPLYSTATPFADECTVLTSTQR